MRDLLLPTFYYRKLPNLPVSKLPTIMTLNL